jgi:hypothetical protein
MSAVIPSEFPSFVRGEYLITKDIDAEDWRTILRANHREFAESGARIPGLYPFPDTDDPSFQTTSGTFTQTSAGTSLDWSAWHPCLSLERDLQNGSSTIVILEFVAVVEICEVRYTIVAEDASSASTTLGTITLTPSGSGVEVLSGSLSISSADADAGGTAGQPPRTITVYAEGRSTSSPSTGTVYADHGHEYRLTASDDASLPRGY